MLAVDRFSGVAKIFRKVFKNCLAKALYKYKLVGAFTLVGGSRSG